MKNKYCRGFNITELMTVMAIIMIVASVAAPYFNAYRNNTNLKEAARSISSDISYYKQRAVSENIHYQINFNAPAAYTIWQETALNSGLFTNLIITKTVGAGNANIIISGTSGFITNTFITFNPRGTTSNCNTTCDVTLKHNIRLSTADINTNLMGRVNVQYNLKH